MGADFGGIRLHVGAGPDQFNQRIQAKAFTSGSDVFISRAHYAPTTPAGQALIAHELTHTIQQGASPVTVRRRPVQTQDGPSTTRHRRPSQPRSRPSSDRFVRRASLFGTTEEDVAEQQQTPDQDIDYGVAFPAKPTEKVAKLTKRKTLRTEPSSKAPAVGEVPGGGLVKILEDTRKVKGKSWVRVEVRSPTPMSGWMNTKDALEERRLDDQPIQEPIMPAAGPSPDHVRQTLLGTCYLLAPLMSLAERNPGFIRDDLFAEDPTEVALRYTVRFHRVDNYRATGIVDEVTVPATVRTLSGGDAVRIVGSAETVMWPAIVEKAFLAWGHKEAGSTADDGKGRHALMYLTGQVHDSGAKEGDARDATQQQLIDALAGDQVGGIVVGTTAEPPEVWRQRCQGQDADSTGREMKVGGICFGHYYQVVAADEQTITLRNPHGSYARVEGQVDLEAADSVLSWEEFWIVVGVNGDILFPGRDGQ